MAIQKKIELTSSKWKETTFRKEDDEIDAFLEAIDATKNQFFLLGQKALHAGSNYLEGISAKNAKGTSIYQEAICQLRLQFLDENWKANTVDGLEVIENKNKKIRIAYSFVDVACIFSVNPKPWSKKGASVERMLKDCLFKDLKSYTKLDDSLNKDDYVTYFLLLDESGRMELSRPTMSNKTFSSYIERNFLGVCDAAVNLQSDLDGDTVSDFDPPVTRK